MLRRNNARSMDVTMRYFRILAKRFLGELRTTYSTSRILPIECFSNGKSFCLSTDYSTEINTARLKAVTSIEVLDVCIKYYE